MNVIHSPVCWLWLILFLLSRRLRVLLLICRVLMRCLQWTWLTEGGSAGCLLTAVGDVTTWWREAAA